MRILATFGLYLVALASLFGAAKTHEESVFVFGNRKVTIVVPDGFGFASNKDERGTLSVQIADRKQRESLQLMFLPDPDGRFATSSWDRKELMNENFKDHVADSVEKGMQFQDLSPRAGVGTFCVFTDASLVGKAKLPPGEFIHATTGVKAWPGVVVIFSLLSNDTVSKEYKALMTLLRDSVEEKRAPSR